MSNEFKLKNAVREQRLARSWTQDELARRAGVSRAEVSAIEVDRVSPSAAVALILAAAFECRVEDLFQLASTTIRTANWAWPPQCEPCRFWQAEILGQKLLYPVETSGLGILPADGLFRNGSLDLANRREPPATLVLACCDPAVGLLAHEMLAAHGVRLLVIPRSSRAALSLVKQGLVHIAGVHLSTDTDRGNTKVVKAEVGDGFRLVHLARWEAGIAAAPARKLRSIRAAVDSGFRWVGREAGSGARQCLDELLGSKAKFRRVAHDHRGVAEAIRCGWADVGVSLRLTAEEAGLDFLSVRHEVYDLCYSRKIDGDPRLAALLQVIRSAHYRDRLAELPGYDTHSTGVSYSSD